MLGKVFIEQDKAIEEIENEIKPKIIKMYLEKVITDQGVYDDLHTNNLGSRQISEYLLKKINFE